MLQSKASFLTKEQVKKIISIFCWHVREPYAQVQQGVDTVIACGGGTGTHTLQEWAAMVRNLQGGSSSKINQIVSDGAVPHSTHL